MTPKDLGIIAEKMWTGDVCTNEELEYFVQQCQPLSAVLGNLGPKFHLAWQELNSNVGRAEDNLKMRKTHGVVYVSVAGKTILERLPQLVNSTN